MPDHPEVRPGGKLSTVGRTRVALVTGTSGGGLGGLAQGAAARRVGVVALMEGEHCAGDLGELAPDLAACALDPRDAHVVVAGGLVAHPGDEGGTGSLLDGDPLGAGDGAAAESDKR